MKWDNRNGGGKILKPDQKHHITEVQALILPLVPCFDKVIGTSGPYLENVTSGLDNPKSPSHL